MAVTLSAMADDITPTGVSCDKSYVELAKGATLQLNATVLPDSATDKSLAWHSIDTTVVKVSDAGLLTAIGSGHAIVTCKTVNKKSATIHINVSDANLEYNTVDLGLPSGLLWSDRYVGAQSQNTGGYFFQWGMTTPQPLPTWDNYTLGASDEEVTKYNYDAKYGPVDDKLTLDPDDDAATVWMGSQWHMPTVSDMLELCNNCTWQIVEGADMENAYAETVKRRYVVGTSKNNGNTITFACDGYIAVSSYGSQYWFGVNTAVRFWSTNLDNGEVSSTTAGKIISVPSAANEIGFVASGTIGNAPTIYLAQPYRGTTGRNVRGVQGTSTPYTPSGIATVTAESATSRTVKHLVNGRIIITHNGHNYNPDGTMAE